MADLSIRDRRFCQDVIQIAEDHLGERNFNVTALCSLLGMNRITLHRKLRLIFNQSASEFIRGLRLTHAAQLLSEGEVTVHQAAIRSGFYNQSYFSKCFKEKFHRLPSEYLNGKKISDSRFQISN